MSVSPEPVVQSNVLYSDEKGEFRYQEGLQYMQNGELEKAILAFSKASFFAPHKPHPFIASAECHVSLYDFQGAVKQYRRSLWLLRSSNGRSNCCSRASGTGRDSRSFFSPQGRPTTAADGSSTAFGSDLMDCNGLDGVSFSVSTDVTGHTIFRRGSSACTTEPYDDASLERAVRRRLAGILDALSIVLFNVEDYEQALRFTDESLELCKDPQVVLHRCAYLIALEREDEAEKVLDKHIEENPSFFILSCSLLVHIYCLRQSFSPAKALLERVPLEERQHPQVLLAQHIFSRTYKTYRNRSIDHSDLQGLTRCISVFPGDSTLLLERAKHYIAKGMDRKAVTDLFRCISASEGRHALAIDLMTETLFRLGSSNDGQSTTADAIKYYTTSLMWRQDNIPVLLARGECYIKMGDYQKALFDFLTVDRISPKHPEATQRIAVLHDIHGCELHREGKHEEAEREFSTAIATCSTEPVFFYHRARCRFDMNQPRYALRDVLSCYNLNPTDPQIRNFVHAHLSAFDQKVIAGGEHGGDLLGGLPGVTRPSPPNRQNVTKSTGMLRQNRRDKQLVEGKRLILMREGDGLSRAFGDTLTCRKVPLALSDKGSRSHSTTCT
ncbi:TPR repeat [Trypanosoma brucei equiperdum]|uniref:TPR repeat n=1 Tax=Trypanosoma brucei equiperdum TaxID=630700 RepID=A0A3L6L2A9_9TRYP|nr:TPR repeat [Trypanosoma brucei equiperdum]